MISAPPLREVRDQRPQPIGVVIHTPERKVARVAEQISTGAGNVIVIGGECLLCRSGAARGAFSALGGELLSVLDRRESRISKALRVRDPVTAPNAVRPIGKRSIPAIAETEPRFTQGRAAFGAARTTVLDATSAVLFAFDARVATTTAARSLVREAVSASAGRALGTLLASVERHASAAATARRDVPRTSPLLFFSTGLLTSGARFSVRGGFATGATRAKSHRPSVAINVAEAKPRKGEVLTVTIEED